MTEKEIAMLKAALDAYERILKVKSDPDDIAQDRLHFMRIRLSELVGADVT